MQVSLFPRKGEIWTVDLAGLRSGNFGLAGLTGSVSPFFFGEKEGLGWMVWLNWRSTGTWIGWTDWLGLTFFLLRKEKEGLGWLD